MVKLFCQRDNIFLKADRLAFQNMLVRWSSEPGGWLYRITTYSALAFATLLVLFAIGKALNGFFLLEPSLAAALVGFLLFFTAAGFSSRGTVTAITKCYGGWVAVLPISYQERLIALRVIILRNCLVISALFSAVIIISHLSASAYQPSRFLFLFLWGGMVLGGEFFGAFYSLWRITNRSGNKSYSFSEKLMAGAAEMFISPDVVLRTREFTFLEHRYAKWLGRWQCQIASGRRGFAMHVVYGVLSLSGSALIGFSSKTNLVTVISGLIFSHLIFMSICRVEPWVNHSVSMGPIKFNNLLFASVRAPMLISVGVYSMFICIGLLMAPDYIIPLFGLLALAVFNLLFLICLAVYPGDRVKGNLIYMVATLAVGAMFQTIGLFGIAVQLLIGVHIYRIGSKRYAQP